MKIVELLISSGLGGAEKSVHDLTKCLLDQGINVKLFLNQEIIKYFQDIDTDKIVNIGSYKRKLHSKNKAINKILNYVNKFSPKLLENMNYRIISKNLINALKKYNPDILHIHLHPALLIFTRLKDDFNFKVVFTMRGDIINFHRINTNKKSEFERKIIRLGLRKAHYITSECQFFFEILKKAHFNVNQNKMIILPKILNLNKLHDIKPFKKTNHFRIVFVGGARFLKGGDLLVNALPLIIKKIPNVKLLILREVSKNNILRKIVLKRNLSNFVNFLGFKELPIYYKYIKSADLGVIPSRSEGIAPSIIEFMAGGIPIVATNIGGTPEIIKDGYNGILVEPTPKSIARGIIKLYNDPSLRNQLGKNAKFVSRKFTCSKNSGEYINFFKQILNNGILCRKPLKNVN
ncbi:MAG: glycosyltransferase family 4 protein [Promethearchaeota archaeon]